MIYIYLYVSQLILLLIFIFTSTLFSWYEGSAILDKPWEWNNSTPLSNLVKGKIESKREILQIDFIIYAIKYKPTFPTIMIISSIYLYYLIGTLLFRINYQRYSFFLFSSGVVLILLSLSLLPIYSLGVLIVFFVLIIVGAISIILSTLLFLRKHNIIKLL